MTDSHDGGEGLPTAAYEWRYVDWDKGHTVLRHDKPNRDSFQVELELKYQLVRRSDVKALIQDKIREVQREKKPLDDGYGNLINGWN
jgi:hypothetical protein